MHCGLLIALLVFHQLAAGVSVTLATSGGRAQFRLGEPIIVTLQSQAAPPARYSIWTNATARHVRLPRYDSFTAEPVIGFADPLADIPTQYDGGAVAGRLPAPVPLGATPVSVELCLNHWLSFRQPGRYRVTAGTMRVVSAVPPYAPLPLRSNTIEIEIVAPPQGWASAQLRGAFTALKQPDPPPPGIGQTIDLRAGQQIHLRAERAARLLRCLETREAVAALVRFFENGPAAAQQELRAGLFASPHREEVIAAMERMVDAPAFPVTYYYLATLIELATATRFGPSPQYPADPRGNPAQAELHSRYLERVKPLGDAYFARLAEAIPRKQDMAAAVSLETLASRGPQPPPPAVLKALLDNFQSLPPNSQFHLLTIQWPLIASPAVEPLLKSLAVSDSPVRDPALVHLHDFNPAAAREITLARLRAGDVSGDGYGNLRVLLLLSDKTLPELDDALIDLLEQGRPVEFLLARYASRAAMPRLRARLDADPMSICGPLGAYFFAMDPPLAAERLARARALGSACILPGAPHEDLLMSEGLERAAIIDLDHRDAVIRRAAQLLLENAGHADALASNLRSLQPPPRISLITSGSGFYASLGHLVFRTRRQLADAVAHFPKGTGFVLERGYEGTWFREQRAREIREILSAAGMRLQDSP